MNYKKSNRAYDYFSENNQLSSKTRFVNKKIAESENTSVFEKQKKFIEKNNYYQLMKKRTMKNNLCREEQTLEQKEELPYILNDNSQNVSFSRNDSQSKVNLRAKPNHRLPSAENKQTARPITAQNQNLFRV